MCKFLLQISTLIFKQCLTFWVIILSAIIAILVSISNTILLKRYLISTQVYSATEAAPAIKDGGTKIIMMRILQVLGDTGFDLSGCPGGIHALKIVRPTQDWLSFIIWDRPKTDQKNFLKSIPGDSNNIFPTSAHDSHIYTTSAHYDSHISTFGYSATEAAPAIKDGDTKIIMMRTLVALGPAIISFQLQRVMILTSVHLTTQLLRLPLLLKKEAKRLLWWEH